MRGRGGIIAVAIAVLAIVFIFMKGGASALSDFRGISLGSDGDDFDLLEDLERSSARANQFLKSSMRRSGYGQNAKLNDQMEAHGYHR